MSSMYDIQRRLKDFHLYDGAIDGIAGLGTVNGLLAVLDAYGAAHTALAPIAQIADTPARLVIPQEWTPFCAMQRIIVHWTAGQNHASALDLEHYHILIEGDGNLIRGGKSIKDNMNTKDGVYAAHTLGCNTQSIGISLCGMVGAIESPFDAGPQPITKIQWDALPLVLRQLCERYAIPVTRQTVLSHAEVQDTLGITQRGKWDIARLPFDASVRDAHAVGDQFRAATALLMAA